MKKRIISSFCFLVIMIVGIFAASATASAASADEPMAVSHALHVIANDSSMAMAGIKGGRITFDSEVFARAMNRSSVESITITEAPPIADGELLIGTSVVNGNQTVSGANLSLMTYAQKSDAGASSYFKFRCDDSPYEIKCELYMLDSVNRAPTLSTAPELTLDVSTHKNVKLYGTLSAYDPEGDDMKIEIVSYPKRGILTMVDAAEGRYTYSPAENFTGSDSFTYVARDKYGNYSASKTVSLTVRSTAASVEYEDLLDSPYHNAALTMAEYRIMGAGEGSLFLPDGTVSREDFLIMAMRSVGMTDVAEASTTPFADTADMTPTGRAYISAAYELGYIKGTYIGDTLCYLPNEPISRAEAAVIVANIIDAATPAVTPVFGDSADVPAFAQGAMASLNYMGILADRGGSIMANADLTRGEAAEMLSLVIRVAE